MTHDTPFWLQPESRRLEFKEAWPGGDRIARTAAAFANGAGGRIVFGVRNEPRAVLGLSDSDLFRLEEQVINHIVDRCAPPIVPEVFIQNADGASLLVVEIYPGSRKPYHLKKSGPDGGTYVRVGSVNRQASREMVAALERESSGVAFDQELRTDVAWDDLDLQEFSVAYQRATDRPLDTAAYKKLGLAADARNGSVPTNAAILLAGAESVRRWFAYAKIECARFKGTTPDVFLDQTTIRGPVFATVEPTLAFIKRNIALGSTIGEVYRTDTWEYPLEALREAITNAVIHRDYWIAGSDIKVAIFDDMLEITSPGSLPDSIAPEALGTGRSEIRNRVLAPIFKDLGLIEAWGTGIQRIRREVEDHGNVRLVFQEVGNAFQVQFVKTNVTAQVTREVTTEVAMEVTTEVSPDVRLASVLDGEMSRRQLMVRLGLRNEEHFRKVYLIPALESGLIERTIPDKPRSSKQKYRLTEKGRRSR
jgi:ATP-dependent DNA helicase RecG